MSATAGLRGRTHVPLLTTELWISVTSLLRSLHGACT